ncbi:helix-turn-helix domain-containing protein [Dactylosporangium roseum]|uniref:Helix-turn-helix domain-containing protein n=1 Tax=Dactylosporangium roseum TaxID=47989 RepID=A0ABY5Z7D8_9ACTN|nr:helix-turn-helix domain-containing protein [Dactylosporangium roseum]UWZ37564.1 helix-turn-helix domain-containing protein [Dactylosporangium roseum]
MEQLPELMTPAEVAEVLRLTDETVHRWARIGKLPYVDVFGVKRFRRSDVEAIVRGETPASAA